MGHTTNLPHDRCFDSVSNRIERNTHTVTTMQKKSALVREDPSHRYRERINLAVDYVRRNIAEDTSLETLARVAGFSAFHFHRVFSEATGETIHTHVTRVRFERAIALMRGAPNKSLTSIAHESGFASSSNFSRKFAQRFGIKPSSLRGEKAMQRFLQSLRQSVQDVVRHDQKSEASVDYEKLHRGVRIESWPALSMAYVRVTGGYLKPDALVAGYLRIEDWADAQPIPRQGSRLVGMSIDDPAVVPLAKCRYDFCRETAVKPKARSGVNHITLPACRWAILACRGDLSEVDRCWTFLFREWLPQSGWQPAAIPALEVFHRRPQEIGWDQFEMDCCVPIEPIVR
jgi:AraC family transcriptional regulator